jgi:hypothetical protein
MAGRKLIDLGALSPAEIIQEHRGNPVQNLAPPTHGQIIRAYVIK